MVRYLSKFMLEVMPSVVATVIGAYIVAHYINPRTADAPKTAVVSTGIAAAGDTKDASDPAADATGAVDVKAADAKPAEVKPTDAKPTDAKPTDAKPTDAKPADAKQADVKPADAKPAAARPVDVKPAVADTSRAKDTEAKAKPAEPVRPQLAAKPATEEKNANELARAAIDRLRGTVDTSAPAPQLARAPAESARVDEAARVAIQPPPVARVPVATTGLAVPQPPSSTAAAPPPLPPPVIVAAPYGRHSVGPEPAGAVAPADQPVEQADTGRPTPPAEIPMQRSYDLQAQAAPVENVSIAEHMLSSTKSFFRAITPH